MKSFVTHIISFFKGQPDLIKIISSIAEAGGVPYLVGGAVRDAVLSVPIKDVDIEIHKINVETLGKVLAQFGVVREVGKQFGVLRIDGLDVDWSLPRRDSKGRKPQVVIDTNLTIEEALRRRDVTMNAMAIDLRSLVACMQDPSRQCLLDIVDPYGGLQDMHQKKMRAVDLKLFIEDPLRFYRVAQFISRFGMMPDSELEALCKTMDITGVAKERIFDEFEKLLLKSTMPSRGIRWLQSIGRLQEIMPEIAILQQVPQRADYHPEGNVFEHTMQSIDAAAQLDESLYRKESVEFNIAPKHIKEPLTLSARQRKLLIMLAVLCHDVGKAVTFDSDGRAHGHEVAGVSLAQKLLKRLTDNTMLLNCIANLVRYHLAPGQLLQQKASLRAYKRLAKKLLPPVTMYELGIVALCDMRGRNGESNEPLCDGMDVALEFWQRVREAAVEHGPEESVLHGRDLMGYVIPGPKMGELLKMAYDIQIEEDIHDKNILLERIKKLVE